jgi:hypothetical protein
MREFIRQFHHGEVGLWATCTNGVEKKAKRWIFWRWCLEWIHTSMLRGKSKPVNIFDTRQFSQRKIALSLDNARFALQNAGPHCLRGVKNIDCF